MFFREEGASSWFIRPKIKERRSGGARVAKACPRRRSELQTDRMSSGSIILLVSTPFENNWKGIVRPRESMRKRK